MTLIDTLVGTAVTLIIFLALFGLLRASLLMASVAKSKAVATAVATTQMEYIRSLPYDSIGTVGGIPQGVVSETSTSTMNNIGYGLRTFIQYVDDPADGVGASDTTGITTDYKRIKVVATYYANGTPRYVELVSNQSPHGIESTTGGGTLQINVVNALGAPVAGAQVDITNPSLSPTVDLSAFTNTAGLVYLPGAATSTDYRVVVTKSGYSTAQTYARDATNQNPTPGYLTVVGNTTTSSTFAVDLLSTFTLATYSPIATTVWSDTFTNASSLSLQSGTAVSGGALVLAGASGSYSASGTARSTALTPTYLAGWTNVDATVSNTGNTSTHVRVLDATGTPLPDSVIPGNSAGIGTFPIDISGVATTTYPTLILEALLDSSLLTDTPSIQDWRITYTRGPVPLPNISFTLAGAKTIGSTGAGAALYKTSTTSSTGASASKTLSLEWDAYDLNVSGYDTVDACTAPPYALAPGVTTNVSLMLGANTTNMLLVSVKDSVGTLVPGASVTLTRSGYSQTVTASSCGTAYFGGITAANDYSVTISKSGYTTTVESNIPVTGDSFYAASFD